jgi:hypothetical protein
MRRVAFPGGTWADWIRVYRASVMQVIRREGRWQRASLNPVADVVVCLISVPVRAHGKESCHNLIR